MHQSCTAFSARTKRPFRRDLTNDVLALSRPPPDVGEAEEVERRGRRHPVTPVGAPSTEVHVAPGIMEREPVSTETFAQHTSSIRLPLWRSSKAMTSRVAEGNLTPRRQSGRHVGRENAPDRQAAQATAPSHDGGLRPPQRQALCRSDREGLECSREGDGQRCRNRRRCTPPCLAHRSAHRWVGSPSSSMNVDWGKDGGTLGVESRSISSRIVVM